MLKKVCVGFDGSDNAFRAFDFALELCELCKAASLDVSVISVAVPPEIANVEVDLDLESLMDSMTDYYTELLEGLKEKAKTKNVTFKAEVLTGHAAEQILKYLTDNKIDMVVMGQKGKSEIEEFLLGSVSRRVARHAPCTVTLVK